MKRESKISPFAIVRIVLVAVPLSVVLMGSDCNQPTEPNVPPWAGCSPVGECCGADGTCYTGNSCNGTRSDARCDYEIQLGDNCGCNDYFSGPGNVGGGGGETLPMTAGTPQFDQFWDTVAANQELLNGSPESLSFFAQGCAQDIYQSCRYQALVQFKSEEPDWAVSAAAAAASCEMGNPRGCFLRGAALHFGVGTPPDDEGAAGYFAQACDMGDSRGCEPEEFLAELFQSYQAAPQR